MPHNDLGPMPTPSTDSAELQPGGPDAPDEEPTGLLRDIRSSLDRPTPTEPTDLSEPSD